MNKQARYIRKWSKIQQVLECGGKVTHTDGDAFYILIVDKEIGMKLTDCIVNPVMETDNWISNESLQLHIKFVSSELSEAYYYRMAEWINEHFVVDFFGGYNLEAQSRDKYVASAKKFLEIFEREMKEHGNTTFFNGTTKKTKKFPSKKSVEKEMEKLNFI